MKKYFLQKLEAAVDSKKEVLEEIAYYESLKEFFEEKNLYRFYEFEDELKDAILESDTDDQEFQLNQILADYYSYSIAELDMDEAQKRSRCFEYVAENKEKFKGYLDVYDLLSLIGSQDYGWMDDEEVKKVDRFIAENFHEDLYDEVENLRRLLDVEKVYGNLKKTYTLNLIGLMEDIENHEAK